VAVTIEEGLPPVHGDRQKLTQVLVNLVRKRGAGKRAVAPDRRRGLAQERPCRLRRRGRGTGRVGGGEGQLFKPFVTSKGEGGMGMGLYMAKLIIDSHQGEIAVLDRPSGGARFEVRLQPAEDTVDRPLHRVRNYEELEGAQAGRSSSGHTAIAPGSDPLQCEVVLSMPDGERPGALVDVSQNGALSSGQGRSGLHRRSPGRGRGALRRHEPYRGEARVGRCAS